MAFSPTMTTGEREQATGGAVDVRIAAAERLTFFADAVIAIAITLLALDLPKPEGSTNAALLHSVYEQRAGYMAFVISFLVIAAHWRGHHWIFRFVTHLDGRLTGFTIGWLFMQVITPFATNVITGDGAFQARFCFYALVQLAGFILFAMMVRQIQVHRLYRADMPTVEFRRIYMRTVAIGSGFLVSIPVSFFTGYSYLCWIVVPVAISVVRHRVMRRAAAN